jgi:hypothetical protein
MEADTMVFYDTVFIPVNLKGGNREQTMESAPYMAINSMAAAHLEPAAMIDGRKIERIVTSY